MNKLHISFIILISGALLLFYNILNAQTYIRFDVQNLKAGPAIGSWMYETEVPAEPQPQDYFINDGNIYNGNYAYQLVGWSTSIGSPEPTPCSGIDELSSGTCIEERTNVLAGINNVALKLDGFTLTQFHHVNTVNPNNNWATMGEAGDERIYSGGVGVIRVGGETKLRAINCRITLKVCYSDPAGQGNIVSGSGWGVIDKDSSDDEWENEFDPLSLGQLEFEFESFSPIVQKCYGKYDAVIKVKPVVNQEFLAAQHAFSGNTLISSISLNQSDVVFTMNSAEKGCMYSDGDYISVNQVKKIPDGSLPVTIKKVGDCFWQLGTTLKSFDTDVTFDISDMTGITDPGNLRILKRPTGTADWQIFSTELLDSKHLKASNVTSFSEFSIGTLGSDPLPVELISFVSSVSLNNVMLKWVTATETNNYGFEIERCLKTQNRNWEKIGFVKGNGTSNISQTYTFNDNSITESGNYLYRLKQLDNDGKYEYSFDIERNIILPYKFALLPNRPNPFNPTTEICYEIPSNGMVNIKIFDLLGREIKELVNEVKEAGKYKVSFDAGGLASGVYIYQLKYAGNIKTMKMNLIK